MELRSPDPALNPYLSFALIIAAGLDGIENNTPLPPAVDADLYTAGDNVTETLAMLPDSLDKAVVLAENSNFVKNIIGEEFLLKYLTIKKSEAGDFAASGDKGRFYKERYFNIV
jgi:glutamine synthetase